MHDRFGNRKTLMCSSPILFFAMDMHRYLRVTSSYISYVVFCKAVFFFSSLELLSFLHIFLVFFFPLLSLVYYLRTYRVTISRFVYSRCIYRQKNGGVLHNAAECSHSKSYKYNSSRAYSSYYSRTYIIVNRSV